MSTALLRRPIFGGVFGQGLYELATTPIVANGLHAVRYFVIEPRAGSVLSISESKTEALAGARRLLRAANAEPAPACSDWKQQALWEPAEVPPTAGVVQAQGVSRRRREIFDKCGGKCHYCTRPLTLDGTWHVEHMLPKALGGNDGAVNLVAACVACNLSKSDQSALEFVAGLAKRGT